MTSPFPGMDPYLEGSMWSDTHHGLASTIRELIAPKIAPAYIARIERYTVRDTAPELGLGIMYPDVGLYKPTDDDVSVVSEPETTYFATPATVTIPNIEPIEIRIPVIELRDRDNNQLITCIEILSPVNKRRPGLAPYRSKRQQLIESKVHLLEIDLLRYGTLPFEHPNVPNTHYHITLVRANAGKTDVWGFNVQDSIPIVPIPLKKPDADVLLDIRKALDMVYERGFFHLSVDYEKVPPKPAFSEEEQAWMMKMLSNR
ncbi:MAG: DUF4058 family protein [Bacteroidota bacterium]